MRVDPTSTLLAEAARSRLVADALRRQSEFEALAGLQELALAKADRAMAEWARALRLERQAHQRAA